MVQLISEDFCAQANIVLVPRQEHDVGNVKGITSCFALVLCRVAWFKGSKNLKLRNDSLLGVAEAAYPHVLIVERPSSNTLTSKAREAKSELVDRARRENVSLGDCQIPVLKGTEYREARHTGAKERNVFIRV